MFKYGSIRNFIVKFLVGIILFGFGLIYFTSLYSYSENDPGFNQLNYNINESNIENLIGFFGAYLSSYSLIFIGTLSYILAFFFIFEGGKLFLGVASRFWALKLFLNLLGIIITNVSLRSVAEIYLERGLISQFIVDLFLNINLPILSIQKKKK